MLQRVHQPQPPIVVHVKRVHLGMEVPVSMISPFLAMMNEIVFVYALDDGSITRIQVGHCERSERGQHCRVGGSASHHAPDRSPLTIHQAPNRIEQRYSSWHDRSVEVGP